MEARPGEICLRINRPEEATGVNDQPLERGMEYIACIAQVKELRLPSAL